MRASYSGGDVVAAKLCLLYVREGKKVKERVRELWRGGDRFFI